MKYKVGDKVKLKSKEGLDELKQQHENLYIPHVLYEKAGSVCTIRSIYDGFYSFEEMPTFWAELLIEGLVEKETKFGTASNPVEPKSNANCLTRERVDELATKIDKELPSGNQNVWELPDGYQFVDENGNVINATKIALEKKKKEYPKTYEECAIIMRVELWNCLWGEDATEYEEQTEDLMDAFIRLKVCRDAYWKIAGEEMGLGRSWEPNDSSGYCTYAILRHTGHIRKSSPYANSKLLEFPTKEMRDAFKENFDPDIEICKELL